MKSCKRQVIGKVTFTVSREIVLINTAGKTYIDFSSCSDEDDGYYVAVDTPQTVPEITNSVFEGASSLMEELESFELPRFTEVVPAEDKEQVE